MTVRCRNCGELHKTNQCTVYGPWFPEAGKLPSDYSGETARIAALVAADILEEHEEHGHGEGDGGAPSPAGAGTEGHQPEAGGEVRGQDSGE